MDVIAYTRGGMVKCFPVGFSWTTLIFGFWPSVFRGDWTFFLICIVAQLISALLCILVFTGHDFFVTPLCTNLVLASIRNVHLHHVLRQRSWVRGTPAQVVQFQRPINDNEH